MSGKQKRNSSAKQEDLEASLELSKLEKPARQYKSTSRKGVGHKNQSSRTFVVDHSSFTADNNSFSTCADGTSKSRQSFVTVQVSDPDVLRMISVARGEASDDDDDNDDTAHNNNNTSSERQSQICCFVFCDLVTAVVAMNSLYVVLLVFHLTISLMDSEHFDMRVKLFREVSFDDDDTLYDDDDDMLGERDVVLDPWAVVRYFKNIAGLLLAVVGIVGALRFSEGLVLASGIWHVLYILLSLVNRTWIGCFLTIPFCYATFHLWVALRAGRITPENYSATEQYCCCCPGRCRRDNDTDNEDNDNEKGIEVVLSPRDGPDR